MKSESHIFDDLGRDRVNPLLSYQIKSWVRSNPSIAAEDQFSAQRYDGEVGFDNSHMEMPFGVESTLQDLSAWATIGASRALLVKPFIDVPVLAGEILEAKQLSTGIQGLIRHIKRLNSNKQSALESIKEVWNGLGEGTLYGLFGVKPLVETVMEMADLDLRIERKINALVAKSNKWQHFHVDLLDDASSASVDLTDPFTPAKQLLSWVHEVSGEKVTTRTDKIWYEGWIRLNLPKLPPRELRDQLRKRLYGLGPSDAGTAARVLYEITPYSWLADWFTSAGALAKLAAEHSAYDWRKTCVMHETDYHRKMTGLLSYWAIQDGQHVKKVCKPKAEVRVVVKRRQRDPLFKLGVATQKGDPFKYAVLAALAARG